MDDFTPPAERNRLEDQWDAFLAGGEAEGMFDLYFPDRGAVPVEFSATANVLPARHLAVFLPLEEEPDAASARPLHAMEPGRRSPAGAIGRRSAGASSE